MHISETRTITSVEWEGETFPLSSRWSFDTPPRFVTMTGSVRFRTKVLYGRAGFRVIREPGRTTVAADPTWLYREDADGRPLHYAAVTDHLQRTSYRVIEAIAAQIPVDIWLVEGSAYLSHLYETLRFLAEEAVTVQRAFITSVATLTDAQPFADAVPSNLFSDAASNRFTWDRLDRYHRFRVVADAAYWPRAH